MTQRARRAPPPVSLAGGVLGLVLAAACGVPLPDPPRRATLVMPAPAEALPVPRDAPDAPTALAPRAAVEVVDLRTGGVLFVQRGEILDRPAWPASVAKVFTLRAALDAGLVDASTRIRCTGPLRVGARVVQCVHPRLLRPLSAVEAMAHSCNTFFVTLARRLDPTLLSRAMETAGLPPLPSDLEDLRLASIGLAGSRIPPRQLLHAFIRTVLDARERQAPGDRLLLEGLRAAAREGTASVLGAAGIDAYAKTGTAMLAPGVPGGMVVAVTPAETPRVGVVVVGAGIAGSEAAAVAVAALQRVDGRSTDDPAVTGGGGRDGQPARSVSGGHVRVGVAQTAGYRVRVVGLEDYVAGVVAAEAGADLPDAARQALAVAARSYALALAPRHAGQGFDFCDLTHCQVWRPPDGPSRAAARATAGEVLTWRGAIVPAFHAASCGGRLDAPSAVWTQREWDEVMPSREDPAAFAHGDDWVSEVAARDLLLVLRQAGWRGDEVRSLRVEARTAGGRVRRLVLGGMVPGDADGEMFRLAVGRTLGWQILKSSLYDLERTARGYRFSGRGRGHGVGLCVTGAGHLARQGATRAAILAAYFPGARLDRLAHLTARAAPVVAVVLPEADEVHRGEVEAIVQRAAAAVAAAARTAIPAGLSMHFHPSVASYERASGQPWWTTGATRGRRIDLLPLAVLRRRGLLERTIRHELAHAVAVTRLEPDAPRWVMEGAALHLSGERLPAPGRPPATCPPDEAFVSATSADALRELYEQALACFTAGLERAGGAWWRVR